jgi:tripartite-type tricarboxylate transporter receptor subunit TctC
VKKLIAVIVLAALAQGAQAADPYFKGRTVNLHVAFAAGGPVDVTTRLMIPYLRKYIPGEPNLVVQNMVGAGGTRAANYIFEVAKGDGENVLIGPWFPVSQVLAQEGIRFKYQDFTLLGALTTPGYLIYARTDAAPDGLKSGADIGKAQNLKFAGQNPFNTYDLLGRLSTELLDVRYSYITGYAGSAGIRPAIMKGEASIGVEGATAYRSVVEPTIVKPGTAVPVWSIPAAGKDGKFVRPPALAEVPTVAEVYKQVRGAEPSGVKWQTLQNVIDLQSSVGWLFLAPPSFKGPGVEDLRKAWAAALTDKEHIAEQEKRFGAAYTLVELASAEKIVRSLGSITPEVKAHLKAHVEAGAQVKQ